MNPENGIAIAVTGLAKRFDDVAAVAGVDFKVRSGELFGFLGPNGAGKTTTINMLTGLARPDTGSIRIGGIDCSGNPRAAQHLVGVVPDESNLYPELTGFENLCFCASLYGLAKRERETRARRLLDDFDLTRAADRKFAGYSKGMKRKLTIAAGIIHRPDILFLDEPTTGIDVASARQLRQLVSELHRQGTTIFLTTHYIEEAERLCDRIAFIVEGRIVRIETVADLIQPLQARQSLQLACANPVDRIPSDLDGRFPDFEFSLTRKGYIRVTSDGPIGVGPLVRFLEDSSYVVTEARRLRPSLEDIFMKITGLEADVMRKEKEKGGKGK
jgi:ABC-2 type transport system ATP-binding protein